MGPRRVDRTILRIVAVLAAAQIIGWGTVGLPSIVGQDMAAALGLDIATIFAGLSVLYVVMGLSAPLLAKAFIRHGARRVMIGGSVLAAPGFLLLAIADNAMLYFAGWIVLGIAGSATLTTAAFIALNERGSAQSTRGAVGALILMTGLSSSIFWPITAGLDEVLGWRGVCLFYAALMILVCAPLYALGLPEIRDNAAPATAAAPEASAAPPSRVLYLVAAAIALNAFVTYGFSAILVDLLKSLGLSLPQAIACGSMLGVLQVATRGLDLVMAGRWDGLHTGLFAGCLLPASMLILAMGGHGTVGVAAFLLLYGLASGALAVARATMPLVFFEKAAYAKALSHIALPLNLASALSPPLLAGLLHGPGLMAVLALAITCSSLAAAILLHLHHIRSATRMVAAP